MLIYMAKPNDLVVGRTRIPEIAAQLVEHLAIRGAAVFNPISPYTNALGAPDEVYRINEYALTQADGLMALLPSDVASVGVPMEIQTAHGAGKPVAVVGRGIHRSVQLCGLGVSRFGEGSLEEAAHWLVTTVRERPAAPGLELRWTGDPECGPKRQYSGDAGFDLVVASDTRVPFNDFRDIDCGISVELPQGVWALITGRSSTLRKRGLLVSQGIIDNGYRGPMFAGVWNLSDTAVTIQRGERIAQLIPMPLEAARLAAAYVGELGPSDRGAAGFGSTGS